MSKPEPFDEEHARQSSIETLRHAMLTINANSDLCIEVLKDLGAPGEKGAKRFLKLVDILLATLAVHIKTGNVVDAAKKMPDSPEVH